ncbi:MAG: hypothetical protein K2Q12_08555 [Rickettsiales bacterium]|nr:hypothetical protein [Rickettsiales bacterium]
MVTAENHPELHRQTLEMNRQLNERHGTHYAPPDVLLVDNNNQIPLYSELADMIVISRRTLEQGNAPAMIAHELAERQGQLTRGDMRLNQEFNLRRDLGLAQPTGTLERHRVNECREDAEAIVLVGPDAYQRAFHSELSPLPHNTDELNYISDGLLRGNASEHYPAILDRLRMVATFRDNPELLARFRNNPQAIQLDGSCNITEVEARGAGTARAPQQVGNDPAQAR